MNKQTQGPQLKQQPQHPFPMRAFLFLLLLCCTPLLHPLPQQNDEELKFLWRVDLRISVSGNYSFLSQNKGFEGEYTFTTSIVGSIQQDEGDFIFVEVWQNTNTDKWMEILFNSQTRSESDLKKQIKPETLVNYVFGQDGKIVFDIDIKPIKIPFKNPLFPKSVQKLQLPMSTGEAFATYKTKYSRGITSGSNKIALAKPALFTNRESRHIYEWKWESGDTAFKQSHSVTLELKLKREDL